MPYKNISDLPDSVQNNVPKHGKEIYLEAFNSAWDTYKNPSDRKGDDDRETVAHKVAWSAVKDNYHKNENGNWVKNKR